MDNVRETTPEVEFKNCAEDFVYFCETYLKIIHPTKGLIPFKLFDYQKRYIKALEDHRFVAAVKFRQGGFTTTTLAWFTWRLLFKLDESNMVLCKSDWEAVGCNRVVRTFLDHLPDDFKPNLSKCNDHQIVYDDANSRIFFHTPQASRGRALSHLFIDESAFIKDMDQHWKAMWPTLSTGGQCITVSTPNGDKGWFYDTVTEARQGKNTFHVVDAYYTEHPDYNNPEWVEQMKKNLGERGWRQEVLGEFLGEYTPDEPEKPKAPDLNPEQDFFDCKSLKEEQEILRKCRQRAALKGVNLNLGQHGHIRDNTDPIKLCCDRSEEPTTMITFDHVPRPHTFREYWWPEVAEEMAEEQIFVNGDDSLDKAIARKRQNLKDLEDRVNECEYSDQLLVLAGVLDSEEVDEKDVNRLNGSNVDHEVLQKVLELGNFPENLKISFSNKKFCVNDVPTNINEFDLCCLYNGLVAFTSHEKAITKVAKLICKRMTPLFGVREGGK